VTIIALKRKGGAVYREEYSAIRTVGMIQKNKKKSGNFFRQRNNTNNTNSISLYHRNTDEELSSYSTTSHDYSTHSVLGDNQVVVSEQQQQLGEDCYDVEHSNRQHKLKDDDVSKAPYPCDTNNHADSEVDSTTCTETAQGEFVKKLGDSSNSALGDSSNSAIVEKLSSYQMIASIRY
jgi:hypothetical protein